MTFGKWPSGSLFASGGAVGRSQAAPPTSFSMRNWWRAVNYSTATGNLPAEAGGSRADTLAQGNAAKRPARTVDSAFGTGKVTMVSDGVDDTMLVAAPSLATRPYTIGVLSRVNATSAGDYLIGCYFTTSYQFFRMTYATDVVYTDPSSSSWPSCDVAGVHLWLFSVDAGASQQVTIYRDGVKLGTRTMNAAAGVGNNMYLFSAGGGYIAASIAEAFTLDQTVTLDQARQLTDWFRADGYLLPQQTRTTEVWIGLGDSEMAGREDPAGSPGGYPPASNLFMYRTNGPWTNLSEPCADGAYPPVGVGPGGLFAWARSTYRNKPTAFINCAVGGVKSSQWLPSDVPTSLYRMCLARAYAAITRQGSYLAGFVLYDGANDALDAVPTWDANWTTTITALRLELGAGRLIFTRLPPTVPTDTSYPGWTGVRAQQAAFALNNSTLAQAPDGPWREAYKLHLNMVGNQAMAATYASIVNV